MDQQIKQESNKSSEDILITINSKGKLKKTISPAITKKWRSLQNKVLAEFPVMELTKERLQLVHDLNQIQLDYITKALDLLEFEPNITNFKNYFIPDQNWNDFIKKLIDSHTIPIDDNAYSITGSTTPFGEIYTKGFRVFTYIHERNHAICKKLYLVEKSPEQKLIIEDFGDGFFRGEKLRDKNFGDGDVLNEAATDLITISIFKRTFKNPKPFIAPSIYLYYDLLIDSIINISTKIICEKNNEEFNGIKQFYQGYFNSNYSLIKFIDDALGEGTIKYLSKITNTSFDNSEIKQEKQIFSICKDLNLSQQIPSKIIERVHWTRGIT